jgi:hypothetical protein
LTLYDTLAGAASSGGASISSLCVISSLIADGTRSGTYGGASTVAGGASTVDGAGTASGEETTTYISIVSCRFRSEKSSFGGAPYGGDSLLFANYGLELLSKSEPKFSAIAPPPEAIRQQQPHAHKHPIRYNPTILSCHIHFMTN